MQLTLLITNDNIDDDADDDDDDDDADDEILTPNVLSSSLSHNAESPTSVIILMKTRLFF